MDSHQIYLGTLLWENVFSNALLGGHDAIFDYFDYVKFGLL